MKKILVTGATGFLGAHLIAALLRKNEGQVIGLKRTNSPMKLVKDFENHVQWMDGDILNQFSLEDAMEGVDEVYHTAAIVSYHPALKAQMELVNVEGTANVVNACLEKKVGKLLHVSSIAALGRVNGQVVVSEKNKWSTWRGTSHYGMTKHKSEIEVFRGIAEGLHANVVNPSVIIGSGFWDRGTSRFFPRVHHGQKLYPAGATGFVDVKDVTEVCIRMMNHDDSGKRVIANAVNLNFLDFFNLLADKLKVAGPSLKVNSFLAGVAWRTEALRSKLFNTTPFLTKETAITAMSTFEFDNTFSKELLDMRYRNFEKTVERVAGDYLEWMNN